jgi:hypothetical protein
MDGGLDLPIGVGEGEGRSAKVFSYALMAGLSGTGVQVWDFGELLPCQMNFIANSCSGNRGRNGRGTVWRNSKENYGFA